MCYAAKTSGMRSDFKEERNRELFSTYQSKIKNSRLSGLEAYHSTINSPAERFYVSEFHAIVNIIRIEKGIPTKASKSRQELYRDLYQIFKSERKKYPTHSTSKIIKNIIYKPAPKFYISYSSFRDIIKSQYAAIRNNRNK